MKVLLTISLVLIYSLLKSQDLESVRNEDPIKVSGSFSLGTNYYCASGIEDRFDPFIWTTSGNINLNVYGVLLPFSFLYSSQNTSVRQPFNRFGVTPYYKWVKLYLGYTTMNFSPFTFNGNSFLGAGVELRPENKIRFSAVYGRLRRAVESNFVSSFIIPTYRRSGFGFKIGYGDDASYVDLVMFRAYDDENSIQVEDSLNINPQENLVLGIDSRYQITRRLSVAFEIATSAINRDRNAEPTTLTTRRIFNDLGGLFRANVSSEFYDAIQAKANYQLEKMDFEVNYKRIDPGYETLSTYFFNNDREEVAFNIGMNLFKDKVYARGGFGRQRNNLEGDESTTLVRLAGNASVNVNVNDRLNFGLNYSSFSSTVEYLVDEFQADSLNYVQVSDNYGAIVNYSVRSGDLNHSFSLNANYQTQNIDAQIENAGLNNSGLWNLNSSYNLNILPIKLRFNLGLNFNSNDISGINSERYGLNAGVSKNLLKNKLQLRLTAGGYNSIRDGNSENFTTNSGISGTFRFDKHHSIDSRIALITRNNNDSESMSPSFQEYRGQINYRYRF
ncbi:MAG: outer membrane beta-barrel protein [Bacteroidota bacterium]